MCSNNAQRDVDFLQDFTIQIIGGSLGPDLSSLGTTTRLEALEESGTRSAEQMTDICAQSGHPVVPAAGKRQNERRSQKAANRHLLHR